MVFELHPISEFIFYLSLNLTLTYCSVLGNIVKNIALTIDRDSTEACQFVM